MTLTPFVIAWSCLAVIVLALAIFRNLKSLHEDDNIHIVAGEQQMIPEQQAFFRKMDALDRWGKSLTILTVATGLVLAALYIWQTMPSGR